jgi:hypothetical protein
VSYPSVRRFPRTTGEAFKDATYASCLERPRPFPWSPLLIAATIVLVSGIGAYGVCLLLN